MGPNQASIRPSGSNFDLVVSSVNKLLGFATTVTKIKAVCNNTEAALALFQDVTAARTKTGKDRKVWFMSKQTVVC